jgi:hypothetical protein
VCLLVSLGIWDHCAGWVCVFVPPPPPPPNNWTVWYLPNVIWTLCYRSLSYPIVGNNNMAAAYEAVAPLTPLPLGFWRDWVIIVRRR